MNSEYTISTIPTFIDHKPIGDDLFEGQPQKRISYSISKLIKTNQLGVKLIGLDGPWGAGKSNLVKMVAENLKDSHHAFYFDAWGHQEDLQRRAFLEELMIDLSNHNLVEKEVWQDRIKSLLARQRETTTKTVPKISNGVIVTLLIFLLTPITVEIAQLVENFLWALSISLSPIILGILAYMIASCKGKRFYSLHELYSLYSDQQVSNETYTTISEKEPTVREFQGWMKKLSTALNEKKLIIVFDNMDRLPPEKVREVWSSIHTFFSEETYESIWVIVPFDRAHLENTFHNHNNNLTLDQFFAKTFSVIYRVALPVLTDWQGYFDVRFREAFDASEDEEFDFVRKVFDSFQVEITPRKIITFINELVALRLTMGERIPLRYIALFVLAKGEILKDPVNQILGRNFLANSSRLFNDDQNLQDNIAALVYNVPVSLASQVTLTREIKTSLNDGNLIRLEVLANHVHFADILEQVVAESYFDVSNACNALSTLLGKTGNDSFSEKQEKRVWDGLCSLKLQEKLNKLEFTETHKILLSNVSESRVKILLKYILENFREAQNFDGMKYFHTMKSIESHVKGVLENFEFKSLVQRKHVSPEIFMDYLFVAKDSYLDYELTCNEEELFEYIQNRFPDKLGGFDVLAVLKNNKLNQMLEEKLVGCIDNNLITAENYASIFKLYRVIATEIPIRYLEAEKIIEFFHSVKEGSNAELELLAMRFARGAAIPPQGGRIDDAVKEVDEGGISQIAEIIEHYTDFGNLLISCVNWHPDGFKKLMANLILQDSESSMLSITDVLPYFTQIVSVLEIDSNKVFDRLDDWSSYAIREITPQNVTNIVADQEFIDIAVQSKSELATHVVSMIVKHLEVLDREDWSIAFRDVKSYALSASVSLLESKHLKSVPENAISEFKLVLYEIAKGEYVWELEEGLDLFYQRTHKGKLKAMAKEIRDMFIRERNITPKKFLLLSRLLFNCAALDEECSGSIRGILTPVLESNGCIEVFLEHSSKIVALVKEAGDDAGDFVEHIMGFLKDYDDDSDLGGFRNAIVKA